MLVCVFSACTDKHRSSTELLQSSSTGRPYSEFTDHFELRDPYSETLATRVSRLTLTIYYLHVGKNTYAALTEQRLIDESYDFIINVSGRKLSYYTKTFAKIIQTPLQPAEGEGREDVRICMIFREGDKEILRVTFWDKDRNMLVNGVPMQDNGEFYDLILPFLPEEDARIFREERPWNQIRIQDAPEG